MSASGDETAFRWNVNAFVVKATSVCGYAALSSESLPICFWFLFCTTSHDEKNVAKTKAEPKETKDNLISFFPTQTSCQLLVLLNPAAKGTPLSHFSCCQTVTVSFSKHRKHSLVSSAAIIGHKTHCAAHETFTFSAGLRSLVFVEMFGWPATSGHNDA